MSDENTQRTIGQSIGYWAIVYAIAIPALFIGTAIVVRLALMSAA
jgi:hypothetical protein